jgi:hypothetical protein
MMMTTLSSDLSMHLLGRAKCIGNNSLSSMNEDRR